MRSCRKNSTTIVASGSTLDKPKCGIREECDPQCDALELIALRDHPEARVWKGSNFPTGQQGIKVLGTGQPDFVSAHLDGKVHDHELLLSRIPAVPDLQSAWALLVHCAATFLLRVVRPEMTHRFASAHDAQLWGCLCQLLDITTTRCNVGSRDTATLPLAMGGMGLRSAMRTRSPACWASWGDCLSMIRARHPEVVTQLLAHLQNPGHPPCLRQAEFWSECLGLPTKLGRSGQRRSSSTSTARGL